MIDAGRQRIFVNVPEADQIVVLDLLTGKTLDSWRNAGARLNYPMALDTMRQRLAVVYRDPARLSVIDARTGRTLTELPVCKDADDIFFDSKRHRLYVSCGEGLVEVFDDETAHVRLIASVPTLPGARTSLWVPELDRLFVAAPERGTGTHAAIWVLRS